MSAAALRESVDDQTVKDGITGTPAISVVGTKLNWGALIDEKTGRADTERLEQALTSGTVPRDLRVTR